MSQGLAGNRANRHHDGERGWFGIGAGTRGLGAVCWDLLVLCGASTPQAALAVARAARHRGNRATDVTVLLWAPLATIAVDPSIFWCIAPTCRTPR